MPKTSNLSLIGLFAALVLIGSVCTLFALKAHANPSDLNLSNTTATTTVSFVVVGTATSTETYDSYGGGVGEPNASDGATLFVQMAASSTSSVLGIQLQYSQNGIDWFDDDLLQLTNATTTQATNVAVANSYTWKAAGTATTSKAFNVPTPTRYVRAVISATGANAAVWKVIIAKKQQP